MAKQRTRVLNTISAIPGNEGMQAFTPMALLQLAATRRSSLKQLVSYMELDMSMRMPQGPRWLNLEVEKALDPLYLPFSA